MILVGIGGNLPGPDGSPPLSACQAAVRALSALPDWRFVALSRWYETVPIPASDQPRYVNGVARFTAVAGALLDPAEVLRRLQGIESRFGRHRGAANAARTLDLDLIDLDGIVRAAPDPVLPHPRAHQRAFVLCPLLDVAPDWVHPVSGRTAEQLLALTGRRGVRLLPS